MSPVHIASKIAIDRRSFLRGLGVGVSLPLLDAMTPAFARAESIQKTPRRMVAMCAGLGFHTPFLVPEKAGRDYELTPYLDLLKDHRDDFTVLSGLSHPEQNGNNGHASELTWLTSAKRPGLAGFKNTISLDQLIASQIGMETRYPYLALSNSGSSSLAWSDSGVEIPAEDSPARLFKQLFIEGTEAEKAQQMKELKRGKSILDTVRGQAQRLHQELGHRDQEKLDEYLSSVRDLESRLQVSEGWVEKPKPIVDAPVPKDIEDKNDAIGKQRLMFDLIALALQTDSTRTVTYRLGGLNSVPTIKGVTQDWHNLSHHGRDDKKIEELKIIESEEFKALNDFLARLKNQQEAGSSLLDNTMVLYGSNLGNASSHSWKNLPVLFAGGGFRHGQHLAHDAENNTEFANLFVQMAQTMGVEIETFGSSARTGIDGLELA